MPCARSSFFSTAVSCWAKKARRRPFKLMRAQHAGGLPLQRAKMICRAPDNNSLGELVFAAGVCFGDSGMHT